MAGVGRGGCAGAEGGSIAGVNGEGGDRSRLGLGLGLGLPGLRASPGPGTFAVGGAGSEPAYSA